MRPGDSWLSLVAATTRGIGELGRVRVRVKSIVPMLGDAFRLVVQSYATSSVAPNGSPYEGATPVASLQRAVTEDELKIGIELDVVHVGTPVPTPEDLVVLAWVEPGRPNFKFDAALARPSIGALHGCALSRHHRGDGKIAELLLTAA